MNRPQNIIHPPQPMLESSSTAINKTISRQASRRVGIAISIMPAKQYLVEALKSQQTPSSTMGKTPKSKNSSLSVRFDTNCICINVPSCHDMDVDHRSALWRAPEDDRTNEADIVRTVCTARSSVPDDDTICIRGLEHLINPTVLIRSQQRRRGMINAVLDIQTREWGEGRLQADPEVIRSVAEARSQEDRKAAVKLAVLDEMACHGAAIVHNTKAA